MLQAVANHKLRTAVACALAAVSLLAPLSASARAPRPEVPSATSAQEASITLEQLPPQGRTTYALIRAGGPFPFDKDGVVFFNRERQLPRQPRGYWREYTVKTPGVRHRGARRIVCGGAPQTPDTCYYSNDHYASFKEIRP